MAGLPFAPHGVPPPVDAARARATCAPCLAAARDGGAQAPLLAHVVAAVAGLVLALLALVGAAACGFAFGRRERAAHQRRLLRALQYRAIADMDEQTLKFVARQLFATAADAPAMMKERHGDEQQGLPAAALATAPLIPTWLRPATIGDPVAWESAAWLNAAVAMLWPSVSEGVGIAIRDATNEILEEYRPRTLLKYLGIKECTLGPCPMKVLGVRCIGNHEPQIEIDVSFDSAAGESTKQLVELVAVTQVGAPVPIRLKRLCITGRILLSLESLTAELPCFGVLGVAFQEQPVISLSLELIGSAGSVSVVPGLQSFLETLISDVVLDFMTAPRRLLVPILSNVPEAAPIGKLKVRVVRAQHLPKMDWFSETDAFVKVSLPSHVAHVLVEPCETEVVMDKANPEFDKAVLFEFDVYDLERQDLEFEVRDWDAVLPSTLIGTCRLPLARFASPGHSSSEEEEELITLPIVAGGAAGAAARRAADGPSPSRPFSGCFPFFGRDQRRLEEQRGATEANNSVDADSKANAGVASVTFTVAFSPIC